MSEENEVSNEENSLDDPENTESVYSGTDPVYQNAAYPVTEPGPLDETKELVAEHEELCRVPAEPRDWASYHSVTSSGYQGDEASAEDGGADDEEEGEEDLESLSTTALRAKASELDIPGRSSMDHDELVAAIEEAEADA